LSDGLNENAIFPLVSSFSKPFTATCVKIIASWWPSGLWCLAAFAVAVYRTCVLWLTF
jgi:hypothetical protein